MIETVTKVDLPVDESLRILKNRIQRGEGRRISIVTGTHGDELEGQAVCFEVAKKVNEHLECLNGTVDIYAALNPLGIDSITRGIPGFDLDMNRIFPGSEDGVMTEYVASKIVGDIKGSDVCIDIHASNIFLREIPQVRINTETAKTLVPLAGFLNVDFIWVHAAATVLESTLAYSLNSIETPTLVVEMGVGMRLTREYSQQLTDGIFCLMRHLGIWSGEVTEPRRPIVSTDGQVQFINAGASGIFIPQVEHTKQVKKGDYLGDIVNPLAGIVEQRILSPCDGMVFTLREYPVVDEGSLIARILEVQG